MEIFNSFCTNVFTVLAKCGLCYWLKKFDCVYYRLWLFTNEMAYCRIHCAKTFYRRNGTNIITHYDDSRGSKAFSGVCMFVFVCVCLWHPFWDTVYSLYSYSDNWMTRT